MADDRTQISIDLKADGFIDSLDKSASKAEDFGDRCTKAMDKLDKSTDKMTKNQQRAYEAMKASYDKNAKAIKAMEAEYEALRAKQKSGQKLTEEEIAKLRDLSKAYSKSAREIANSAKDMEALNKRLGEGSEGAKKFGDVAKIAFGNVLATAMEKAISLATDLAKQMVELGLKAEQMTSQLGAMKNNTMGGAKAYEEFNNVLRNTNWQEDTVMNMGKQLMNLGYSASQSAEYIQILADTSAGLGSGEQGAMALMGTLNKIKSTAQFTAKDMKALQQEGLHVEEAFAKAFGTDTQTAMAKIKEGAVDGQQAFEILTHYMEQNFTNAMNESKANLIDGWGDISGNIQTMLGDIGRAIAEGFGKTEIMQGLIDLTNEWVEDVRSAIQVVRDDFAPLFEFLGNLAGGAFKILVAGLNLAISAFKVAYEVAQPFINALMEIFRWANKVFDALGGLLSRMGKVWSEASAIGEYEGDLGLDLGVDNAGVTGFKGEGAYTFNKTNSSKSSGTDANKKAREDLNNSLNGIKEKYAGIAEKLRETRKGEDELTKASNAYTNNELKGLDLIKAQNEQRMAQMAVQAQREKDDHASRIAMLTEQKTALQEAMDAGLIDGSDQRLAQIDAQIVKENELHGIRVKNMDELMKKTEILNAQRVQKEKEAETAVNAYYKGMAKQFSASMADCIMNAKSFGDAFKEIIKQVIQQLIQALIYAMLLSTFTGGATGGGWGNFGKNFSKGFFGHADGGLILGAGSGTSDSIPAMLSNGEYVINAEATRKNLPLLNAINYGHFADGGLVGGSGASGGSVGGSTVVLNLSTIDADSFSSFLSRGGMKAIKQAMLDDERNLNTAFGTF